MKQTVITPVNILINGKFAAKADMIELMDASEYDGDLQLSGKILNIIKKASRTTEEITESTEDESKKHYDNFFKKMVNSIDSHIPVS